MSAKLRRFNVVMDQGETWLDTCDDGDILSFPLATMPTVMLASDVDAWAAEIRAVVKAAEHVSAYLRGAWETHPVYGYVSRCDVCKGPWWDMAGGKDRGELQHAPDCRAVALRAALDAAKPKPDELLAPDA